MKNGIKIFSSAIFVLVIIVFGWYLISRACHKYYPIKIYTSHNPQIPQRPGNIHKLKLGAYNIAHARGGKRGASNFQNTSREEIFQHLDRLSEQITQANLDIVVLNEVDFKSAWSHHINVAEYIMDKAKFGYRLEQVNTSISVPFFSFRYGNAILSKYPIHSAKFLDFPSISRVEDLFSGTHDGVYCEIMTPWGNLGVLPVHLEYRSEDIRVGSIKMMIDQVSNVDLPILAFGDFNSTITNAPQYQTSRGGQNAMEYLLDNGQFIPYLSPDIEPGSYTFPSEKPDRIIDWITGRNIHGFVNSQTIASNLSDHLMIISEVVIDASSPLNI